MIRPLYVSLLAAVLFAQPAMPAGKASCDAVRKLSLPDTTISIADLVPAGTFKAPDKTPVSAMPSFCRIAGVIKPTPDSNIQFEVWMPDEGWNKKFQGVGNGGFAGNIGYSALSDAVSHGYASASTDTGHPPGTGVDAKWALGHPEKIADFGYRAIHETAVKAKAIIAAFYGTPASHSYFSSCSNGGRQALMEAQRYPADYDGIVAGAPANNWTHLLVLAAYDVKALLADPESYIPSSKLPAITKAALAACDALDGLKDNEIDNPANCHFDPSTLVCKDADSDTCLTQKQVNALQQIYAGPVDSKSQSIFPGYSPGGEAEQGGWTLWITGPAPERSLMYLFGTQYFKNMVFDNPDWDFRTFDVDRDTKTADDKTAKFLNATDPDLSKFKARGGKLIMYHGWSDAAIPAQNAINYYRSVSDKMGAKDTDSFLRLFMVPGMQHCGGGSGPNNFGQFTVAAADAKHDVTAALEQWVEKGTPPDSIIATKRQSDTNSLSGIVRTRPLCPYPQLAQYKGTGSTDDAANFTCATK